MSSPDFPRPEADHWFTCSQVSAEPAQVSRIRDEFARWLRCSTGLGEPKLCDVVLAVNEALANTAEFAYTRDGSGTVEVEALRDPVRRTLTVTVSDHGRWRETNPLNRQRCRGRGLPLMRTLADSVVIDTSGLGTRVCMRFDDVRPDLPVGAGVG